MAAQLDHADSDGLLRDRPFTSMGCCVLSEEHTFSEEVKEVYVECRSGVSTGDRVTAAPDGLSQTWSVKRRAGYSPRRRSRNAEQRVTLSEEEGEATSDALCEGGVSGDRRGLCAGQQQ